MSIYVVCQGNRGLYLGKTKDIMLRYQIKERSRTDFTAWSECPVPDDDQEFRYRYVMVGVV